MSSRLLAIALVLMAALTGTAGGAPYPGHHEHSDGGLLPSSVSDGTDADSYAAATLISTQPPPVSPPAPLTAPSRPVLPEDVMAERAIASRDPIRRRSFLRPFEPWSGRFTRGGSSRLASVPHMFGDYLHSDRQYTEENGLGRTLVTDMPVVAGSRVKVADNSSAVAMDRAYLMYQHFHNALEFDADPTLITRPTNGSVDRLTVGLEKAIFDGAASLDFRLPVYSSFGFPGAPFGGFDGGTLGNLTVTPKLILSEDDTRIWSAGLGINTPTGGDSTILTGGNAFTVHNQAVHLLPFIALCTAPGDVEFLQAFAQLDLATNGNEVTYYDSLAGSNRDAGVFTEQNLLHVDVMAGRWLWRDQPGPIAGLACLLEIHYTTTVQDTDLVAVSTGFGPIAALVNTNNRQDVVNLTTGLHCLLNSGLAVRVAGVLPLRDEDHRFFDSEVNVQVNWQF